MVKKKPTKQTNKKQLIVWLHEICVVLTPWPRETLSSAWFCGEKTDVFWVQMLLWCLFFGRGSSKLTKQADILAFLPQKQDFWRRYWLRGNPLAPCKPSDDTSKCQIKDFTQQHRIFFFYLLSCFFKLYVRLSLLGYCKNTVVQHASPWRGTSPALITSSGMFIWSDLFDKSMINYASVKLN